MTFAARNIKPASAGVLPVEIADATGFLPPDLDTVDPEIIYRVRAETLAILVEAGELDLHFAIDLLHDEAAANRFDTDTSQAIMNEAFTATHARPPITERPHRKRDYWLVREDGVASPAELERLQAGFAKREREQHGAPQVTYDALVYAYREARQQGNTKVFEEPANKERLSRLSAKQRADLAAFIQRCEQKP